ncbi:MAG: methyl-accepting chemotaxis protein [Candidatus Omnitrophica bacterium]|nr:methyl-accepting chemotaxis protein [Candidatus Omnitrophota bacterium]
MEKPKRIRRRQYLIKTRFQLKYTGIIILFMFAVAWAAGYTVYYTGWLLMGEKLANVYPQGRLIAIMRTINATLLLRVLLIAPFIALLSVFLSHKVAGPLYRIERFIKQVASGDLSAKLKLRRGDDLKDVAEAINQMTDDLKNRVNRLKAITNTAGLEIGRLKTRIGESNPDINIVKKEIEELAKNIKDLDNHLSEYRLSAED